MSKRHKVIIISNQQFVFEEIKDCFDGTDIEFEYLDENLFNKTVELKADIVVFCGTNAVPHNILDYCTKNNIALIDYSSPVPEALMLEQIYNVFAEYNPEYFSANMFFSASYHGREGVEELTRQTISLFNQGTVENSVFPKRIAFNMLPGLGRIMNDGRTVVESGIEEILAKKISNKNIFINTFVLPVITGVAVHINLKTDKAVSVSRITKSFEDSDDFLYYPDLNDLPTLLDQEKDKIHVGRLRDCGNGYFNLFAVTDNMKTLRTIPIAEQIKRIIR